ncbi:hypothetical protein BW247_04930 [Acidihalobacter ferrooxydans]|uniref:WGR domain-containing protein n=1 Tax=Acidihalobacter ferrooxydans TaxID=1765967 RepID=A0A1P8UFA7_9GAMM|nr:hypothetical protein BW247_04930 [Acidihalobacter ferrooxydans]
MNGVLFYNKNGSDKFWAISVRESICYTFFGRRGRDGQVRRKHFAGSRVANAYSEKSLMKNLIRGTNQCRLLCMVFQKNGSSMLFSGRMGSTRTTIQNQNRSHPRIPESQPSSPGRQKNALRWKTSMTRSPWLIRC